MPSDADRRRADMIRDLLRRAEQSRGGPFGVDFGTTSSSVPPRPGMGGVAHTPDEAAALRFDPLRYAVKPQAPPNREGELEADRDRWRRKWEETGRALSAALTRNVTLAGRIAQLETQVRAQAAPAPALSRSTVTRLIALVHPDKHDNSREATELTQLLLALRPKS